MIKYFNKLFSSKSRFHYLILRRVHNDLKVPDFDYYRRNSSKDPKKSRDKRENDAIKSKVGTYMTFAGLYLGTLYGTKTVMEECILIMAPSADVLAMATIEVDLTSIPEGVNSTFKWRNKPLFILHRTPEDIEREKSVSIATLRDPAHDQDRCENPEWLIVIGVCTHLGCVPIAHAGDFGGYYCPCHGSHFDASGRIRKGPAPTNLEIPPHTFLENGKLIVG